MNIGALGAGHAAAPGVHEADPACTPGPGAAVASTPAERRRSPRASAFDPRPDAEEREVELPPSSGRFAAPPFRRFYEPDSVRVMTDALDIATHMLPTAGRGNESLRRRLALQIMREVDAGERDPARLATIAVLSIRM